MFALAKISTTHLSQPRRHCASLVSPKMPHDKTHFRAIERPKIVLAMIIFPTKLLSRAFTCVSLMLGFGQLDGKGEQQSIV